jgi:SAM-dependent methyltransferase
MFSKTPRYYDKIYASKNYQAEAQRLIAFIRENLYSGGNQLLDVACGTGRHIEYLKKHFAVEGLDISEELLEVARQRNPGVLFHQADMIQFELGKRFDVVTLVVQLDWLHADNREPEASGQLYGTTCRARRGCVHRALVHAGYVASQDSARAIHRRARAQDCPDQHELCRGTTVIL